MRLHNRLAAIAILSAALLTLLFVGRAARAAAVIQIDGRVVADADKDGKPSAGDRAVKTLVELQRLEAGKVTSVTGVFTDANGNFAFTGVADGDYELVVWWSPGFVSPAADPARPQSLVTPLNAQTASQSQLRGLSFLVSPKPDESLIPWPVRSGQDAIPVGVAVLNVTLPSTGDGWPRGTSYLGFLAVGVLILIGSSTFLWLYGRRG